MKRQGHTPARWVVKRGNSKSTEFYIRPAPSYLGGPKMSRSAGAIAMIPPSAFHDTEANAHLLAEAPRLLAKLQYLAEMITWTEGTQCEKDEIDALIASAKGITAERKKP